MIMTTTEAIDALNTTQEKAVFEINEIKTNYEMGLISRTEYLAQVSHVTKKYDEVSGKILNDAELSWEFYAGYQFAKMQ
jgi:hypothetical protein